MQNSKAKELNAEELESISGGRMTSEDGLDCEHVMTGKVRYTDKKDKRFFMFTCRKCRKRVYSVRDDEGNTTFITERIYRRELGI
jgi:bacteriocin-like protein